MATRFLFYDTTTPDTYLQSPFQVYTGVAAPATMVGVDGDFYFRYDNSAVGGIYKKVSGTWVSISGGETNDGASLGSGLPIYTGKSGATLQFKSLIQGANIILTPTGNDITISAPTPGEVNTTNSLGSGSAITAGKVGSVLNFKSLIQGTGINLSSDGNSITISSTGSGSGSVNSASNVGTGVPVFKAKVSDDLQFRTILATGRVAAVMGPNELTITTTAEANTGSNLGTGSNIFESKVGETLQFRTLKSNSPNLTVTQSATEIALDLTGLASGTITNGANVGTGEASLFRDVTGSVLNFKRLKAGAGVTLTNNANEIQIDVAGSGGSGISSLNSLTSANQTFANDANVTITSSGATHTLGWTGQLSLTRGGTGSTLTAVAGGIAYSTATGLAISASGVSGQLLQSNGANAPTWFTPNFVSTASNLGSGEQVFSGKVGSDLQFKSLIQGSGIQLTSNASGITISSTGGTSGVSSLNGLTGPVTLVQGTGITITPSGNNITISSTGGGGGGISSLNGLTGSTQTFKPDTNLTINSSGTEHTLAWLGQLSLSRGGTGASLTATLGAVAYSTASGLALTAAGTAGQVLTSNGNAAPTWKTLSALTSASFGNPLDGEAVGSISGTALEFKRLKQGTGVTIATVGDSIEISATGTSGVSTINGLSGAVVLQAGSNITLTPTGNTITINSTAGGTGTITGGTNLGTGSGQVFASTSGANLQFRNIKAGSNVTVTQDGTDITIAASGSGGGGGGVPNLGTREVSQFSIYLGQGGGGTYNGIIENMTLPSGWSAKNGTGTAVNTVGGDFAIATAIAGEATSDQDLVFKHNLGMVPIDVRVVSYKLGGPAATNRIFLPNLYNPDSGLEAFMKADSAGSQLVLKGFSGVTNPAANHYLLLITFIKLT